MNKGDEGADGRDMAVLARKANTFISLYKVIVEYERERGADRKYHLMIAVVSEYMNTA